MHFPALLADQRLTQLQHLSNSHGPYSSNCKATHTSPIQISCVILIFLGMLAKAAFAIESLDWMDCEYYYLYSDWNLVFEKTSNYLCGFVMDLGFDVGVVVGRRSMKYCWGHGYGLGWG
ncbi:7793865d-67bc-4c60-b288-1dadf224a8e4 [Sclerotinia trifoliorum]|uniref:7793865d-67bc-4c60-b288-1dadf224a8e4 n=1 Tax=Sclerotinia trifoliorum TaxID=28548 RepID=A0A8H2VX36_9HELO|nr:7793865d-67bc-4c60-b288-1dadf224a8e4 [Sclerotinia trifoliorum]